MFASLLVVAGLISVACGQLTVTQPTTSHFWVANSQNTLAWSGTSPATFSVFLSNPNVNLLTATTALISIEQTYNTAVTVVPNFTPGTGYVILLTDTLNSTNVYARSQSFEIKPVGSLYPTDTTTVASATGSVVSVTGSGSATGSASATGAAATGAKSGAEGRWEGLGLGTLGMGAAGLVGLLMA